MKTQEADESKDMPKVQELGAEFKRGVEYILTLPGELGSRSVVDSLYYVRSVAGI